MGKLGEVGLREMEWKRTNRIYAAQDKANYGPW